MKKTYKMIDLDCANCAAKMEEAIKKIDGVTSASVSFMTQKMTIEGDDARFDQIVKEAVKVCRKVEPCLLYTSPSPRDGLLSRMPSSA